MQAAVVLNLEQSPIITHISENEVIIYQKILYLSENIETL